MGRLEVRTEVNGEPVSRLLEPLLAAIRTEFLRDSLDQAAVAAAIVPLLEYLDTPEGRTNANLIATSDYFGDYDWDPELWPGDLPEPIDDLLFDIRGPMIDSIKHPGQAEGFDATPEQLLGRVRMMTAT